MQRITNSAELKAAINTLEIKHQANIVLVKSEINELRESFSVKGLIKKMTGHSGSPSILQELVKETAMSLLTRYLTKSETAGKRTITSRILISCFRFALTFISGGREASKDQ